MLIETDDYVDASEAGRLMNVGRSTISVYCRQGRFPGQVKIGHFWLIPLESVINFEKAKRGPKFKH